MTTPREPATDHRFPHGVASGEVTTSSLAIWTRVSADEPARELGWEVAAGDAPGGRPARTGSVIARREHDHTVTVLVDGLLPATSYRYRFTGPDLVSSPWGHARTLPTSADRFRIGVTCCARYASGTFEVYRHLADERPDVVIHLGDYIYEDGRRLPGGRRPDPPYEPITATDYRRRYASYGRDADLRALHEAAPMYVLWDDHEAAERAPWESSDQARRRRVDGRRVWREWLPVASAAERRSIQSDADDLAPGELDRLVRIGGLVDVVMVDARFTGRDPAQTQGPSAEPRWHGPLLSSAQWEWLEHVMTTSTAPWRVLANQVQVAPMRLGYVPTLRLWPPWAPIINPDQWDGYPRERDRLYDLLERSGPTLLLSGDLHSSWVRAIRRRGRLLTHELTVPSVAGESYAEAFTKRTHLSKGVLRGVTRMWNRGIVFVDLARHGSLLLDVAAHQVEATFLLEDRTGGPAERRRSVLGDGRSALSRVDDPRQNN